MMTWRPNYIMPYRLILPFEYQGCPELVSSLYLNGYLNFVFYFGFYFFFFHFRKLTRIESTRLRLALFESWRVESTATTISLSQRLWNNSAPGSNLLPSSSRNGLKDSSKENTSRDQMQTEKHMSTWHKELIK